MVWKAVTLALKSRNLPTSAWEIVLPDVLHSIRSLLCTSTNCTPHERLFNYQRKSTTGNSVPSWLLTPGLVYVKKHARKSKYDPLVEEAELIEANPEYAHVRLKTGYETTVSLRELAPCRRDPMVDNLGKTIRLNKENSAPVNGNAQSDIVLPDVTTSSGDAASQDHNVTTSQEAAEPDAPRRSTRVSAAPQRYGFEQ